MTKNEAVRVVLETAMARKAIRGIAQPVAEIALANLTGDVATVRKLRAGRAAAKAAEATCDAIIARAEAREDFQAAVSGWIFDALRGAR